MNGKRNGRPARKYVNFLAEATMTPDADLGLQYVVHTDLHATVENLKSGDGVQSLVQRMIFRVRAYSTVHFSLIGVAVQTAGTWTNASSATRVLDLMLDESIDDVFGFEYLGNLMFSKAVPVQTGGDQGIEMTIPFPQRLVQILNKEVETERLQKLMFGLLGVVSSQQNVLLNESIEIDFTEVRKKVVLR